MTWMIFQHFPRKWSFLPHPHPIPPGIPPRGGFKRIFHVFHFEAPGCVKISDLPIWIHCINRTINSTRLSHTHTHTPAPNQITVFCEFELSYDATPVKKWVFSSLAHSLIWSLSPRVLNLNRKDRLIFSHFPSTFHWFIGCRNFCRGGLSHAHTSFHFHPFKLISRAYQASLTWNLVFNISDWSVETSRRSLDLPPIWFQLWIFHYLTTSHYNSLFSLSLSPLIF